MFCKFKKISVQLLICDTLNALFVSAGIAIAAPLICSCMMRDWSAPVANVRKLTAYVLHIQGLP